MTPERGLLDWYAEQLQAAQAEVIALARAHLAVLAVRDEHEEAQEHALCYAEWHRCDDGGPGEYERYISGQVAE